MKGDSYINLPDDECWEDYITKKFVPQETIQSVELLIEGAQLIKSGEILSGCWNVVKAFEMSQCNCFTKALSKEAYVEIFEILAGHSYNEGVYCFVKGFVARKSGNTASAKSEFAKSLRCSNGVSEELLISERFATDQSNFLDFERQTLYSNSPRLKFQLAMLLEFDSADISDFKNEIDLIDINGHFYKEKLLQKNRTFHEVNILLAQCLLIAPHFTCAAARMDFSYDEMKIIKNINYNEVLKNILSRIDRALFTPNGYSSCDVSVQIFINELEILAIFCDTDEMQRNRSLADLIEILWFKRDKELTLEFITLHNQSVAAGRERTSAVRREIIESNASGTEPLIFNQIKSLIELKSIEIEEDRNCDTSTDLDISKHSLYDSSRDWDQQDPEIW